MKLIRQTQLHFREGNSDKVYEVDLCETDGKFVVNFRYGRRGANLKEGTKTATPVSMAQAETIFQKLVDEKTGKGYRVVSSDAVSAQLQQKTVVSKTVDDDARTKAILDRLNKPNAKHKWKLERVIWRAGELKIKEAAPLLINLIGTGNALRDYCIAWSLGWYGDDDSLTPLSQLYFNPNSPEFVKRIASEAIMKLSDEDDRRYLKDRIASLLPAELRDSAINGTSENFSENLRAYLQNPTPEHCEVLNQLYSIDNEFIRPVLLPLLRTIPFRPNYFKPLRHIFKMAEYRHDAEVFGIIARRLEDEKAMYRYPGFWLSNWGVPNVGFINENGQYEWITLNSIKAKDAKIAYGSKQ